MTKDGMQGEELVAPATEAVATVRRRVVGWKVVAGVVDLVVGSAMLAAALVVAATGAIPMAVCAGVLGAGFAVLGGALLLRPVELVCGRCGGPRRRLRARYAAPHRGALVRGVEVGGAGLLEAMDGGPPAPGDGEASALVVEVCSRCGETGSVAVVTQAAAMRAAGSDAVTAWRDGESTKAVELECEALAAVVRRAESRGAEAEAAPTWWRRLLPF